MLRQSIENTAGVLTDPDRSHGQQDGNQLARHFPYRCHHPSTTITRAATVVRGPNDAAGKVSEPIQRQNAQAAGQNILRPSPENCCCSCCLFAVVVYVVVVVILILPPRSQQGQNPQNRPVSDVPNRIQHAIDQFRGEHRLGTAVATAAAAADERCVVSLLLLLLLFHHFPHEQRVHRVRAAGRRLGFQGVVGCGCGGTVGVARRRCCCCCFDRVVGSLFLSPQYALRVFLAFIG